MIKFFRKIRYNLMEQNKTGKYLKYAIGEIVLVVIGILIALSINNWNEKRKTRTFEVKMLREIQKSINYDNNYLQDLIDTRIKKIDTSGIVLMQMLKQDVIEEDKVFRVVLDMNVGFIFQYSKGAYETLKTSGLDKVSNDSLRDELIYFYDFVAPRTEKLLDYHQNSNMLSLQRDLKWEIFEYEIQKSELKGGKLYIGPC